MYQFDKLQQIDFTKQSGLGLTNIVGNLTKKIGRSSLALAQSLSKSLLKFQDENLKNGLLKNTKPIGNEVGVVSLKLVKEHNCLCALFSDSTLRVRLLGPGASLKELIDINLLSIGLPPVALQNDRSTEYKVQRAHI